MAEIARTEQRAAFCSDWDSSARMVIKPVVTRRCSQPRFHVLIGPLQAIARRVRLFRYVMMRSGRFGWFGFVMTSIPSIPWWSVLASVVDLLQVESVLDGSEQMVWFVMTSIP